MTQVQNFSEEDNNNSPQYDTYEWYPMKEDYDYFIRVKDTRRLKTHTVLIGLILSLFSLICMEIIFQKIAHILIISICLSFIFTSMIAYWITRYYITPTVEEENVFIKGNKILDYHDLQITSHIMNSLKYAPVEVYEHYHKMLHDHNYIPHEFNEKFYDAQLCYISNNDSINNEYIADPSGYGIINVAIMENTDEEDKSNTFNNNQSITNRLNSELRDYCSEFNGIIIRNQKIQDVINNLKLGLKQYNFMSDDNQEVFIKLFEETLNMFKIMSSSAIGTSSDILEENLWLKNFIILDEKISLCLKKHHDELENRIKKEYDEISKITINKNNMNNSSKQKENNEKVEKTGSTKLSMKNKESNNGQSDLNTTKDVINNEE